MDIEKLIERFLRRAAGNFICPVADTLQSAILDFPVR